MDLPQFVGQLKQYELVRKLTMRAGDALSNARGGADVDEGGTSSGEVC